MCIHVYMSVCIYIYREREGERVFVCVFSAPTTPLKQQLRFFMFRGGCFWTALGRFGGYVREMFGQALGTCLGSVGRILRYC